MSDDNENTPDRVEPSLGFNPEDEAAAPDHQGEAAEPDSTQGGSTRKKERPAPTRKTDEWRRNISSVFGQGIGRISIIGASIVVLIMVAVGVRTLTSASRKAADKADAQVEVPNAPTAPIDNRAVSQKEAERRNNASAHEAEQAQLSGESYQPSFMPNITPNEPKPGGTNDIFKSNHANQVPPSSMPPPNAADADNERRLLEEARRRQAQAYEDAVRKRDAYVTKQQEVVLTQLNKILRDDALNKIGTNSPAAYAVPVAATHPADQQAGATPGNSNANGQQSSQRTPLIRTGNVLYAETISAINTDDGTDVMAVIRGGAWDGSKLIGKVENRPNNIGVKFTTLAPQDGRPTMSINAVALRTADASQGIAEDIDHHTLERYIALGASSLLSGFGKAYAQTPGTAVIAPSGTTVTTTQEPSSKQVLATALGELGTNASQEIQRGFNRPTTYSTPANQGIAVFFLADVMAPN